jgi:hypothetical protein
MVTPFGLGLTIYDLYLTLFFPFFPEISVEKRSPKTRGKTYIV